MSQLDPAIYRLSEKVATLKYTDLLPHNATSQQETREFLQKIVDLLIDYVELCFNRDEPVLDFHQPECLTDKFDMNIPEYGLPLSQLLEDCAKTLKHQVKSGHPQFMNQLATGLDIFSMAGEWLTATSNSNMFTYEISPVFITMEHTVLEKMRRIIGFKSGESLLAPGGSISNMYAVLLARFKLFPDCKLKGTSCIPGELCIFTSDQGHYSLKIAASVTGVGIDNCFIVESDSQGRMKPDALDEAITEQKKNGKIPIMVNATAGTTVLGAFDPLVEIADVCTKHGVWLHVDAAWGGGLLFSRKHRNPHFNGIERADSVTWNPHKLMGTTLQCSTFHTQHNDILEKCNKVSAEYLFMTDKLYDTHQYDTGDRLIQCGRHNDIFKLWLQWRSRGDMGFEARMDRFMDLTTYQVKKMKERSDKFHLLMDPNFVNVCFWYIPKSLRDVPHDGEKEAKLGLLCPRIKSRMMKAGTLMVGYTRDSKLPNFFRSVISQEAITEQDIDFMLDEIDRLGEDL